MILLTAWKNVWRNHTRSLVVIASITIGIFAGVFAVALMNGTLEQRIDAALNEEISHIQINHSEFRENYDISYRLEDISQMNELLLSQEGVAGIANRLIINGMVNTATKSVGLQIVGINPEQEKAILALDKNLIEGTGSFFEKESKSNLAFIGEELAKELNIIRYSLKQETLDTLAQGNIPDEVVEKLMPLAGRRFANNKAFTKAVNKLLTQKESYKYGREIVQAAWSFRSRSKMTLTFLDRDNIMTGAMFRIAGIYDLKNTMFEKGQIFVLNSDLRNLTGIDAHSAHMTLVRTSDRKEAKAIVSQLKKELPALEIQSWEEIAPDLAMMTMMVEKFNAIFMIIILAALSFGIINTMLMVVLERTKELGMLTAIGMNKKKVFSMIMSESIFLSLAGGVVGMFISLIFLSITSKNGINFRTAAEGFEAMGFSAHIYPNVGALFFIETTILIILTGIIASIYPALKALRLDPAEALRTE